MSANTRLDRLIANLTPRQRAVLVLRERSAGREPDRSLYAPLPKPERREYNRFVALFYILNYEMAAWIKMIAFLLTDLDYDKQVLDTLMEGAVDLERQLELKPPKRDLANWRRRRPLTPPLLLRGLSDDLRRNGLAYVEENS